MSEQLRKDVLVAMLSAEWKKRIEAACQPINTQYRQQMDEIRKGKP